MRYPTRESEFDHRRLQVPPSPLHDLSPRPSCPHGSKRAINRALALDEGHQSPLAQSGRSQRCLIDVFVEALDLAEMSFDGVEPAATGRPSYHPSVLLKLYIYGYLNRVQSSRRLEREAGRNVEVMWLLGRLAPDHKTIAGFRKDNGLALRKVCARFVELCREMGLLATASVAIDGSKFKAVNNRDKNFTRAKVERRRAQLEESVARYLSQLDTADRQEPTEALAAKVTRLTEKLTKLKEEMGKLAVYEKQMLASPDQQISLTDPDSRSMATSGRGSGVVGYNVQVAVDAEHHLIVTHEVTNSGSDRHN